MFCFDFIKSTSSQANREEVFAEHQRKKINHKEEVRREHKKVEAEKLLARQVSQGNIEEKNVSVLSD